MTPTLLLPSSTTLTAEDEATLSDLYRRGTPENTIRASERDLAYIGT